MILYNITFKVELTHVDAFHHYIQEQHFVELNTSKYLFDYKMFRLLHQDDSEGLTFTLQYFIPDLGTYNQHIAVIDSKLKHELYQRFGEKVLYFCSVLEKI